MKKGGPLPTLAQEGIFKSRCLVQGKVCTLIIDSGAHSNLVSIDMVSKLGLALVEHPNPYSATWVNQELNVRVSQKALVNFSIGPYHDQVWCDVISMNYGHMILGRPWQCMRRTIHDGYTNTYIVHKGK